MNENSDYHVEYYLNDQPIGRSCITQRYEFLEYYFKLSQNSVPRFTLDSLKIRPIKKCVDF